LVREAAMACLDELLSQENTSGRDLQPLVAKRHFDIAFKKVFPIGKSKVIKSISSIHRSVILRIMIIISFQNSLIIDLK
jgi:hypothetical protein